jgi:diaphanous 1
VSDLLAAICILAIPEGHKMVMASMSDYRIVFEESFRFEELISSLRLPEADPNDFTGSGAHSSEDDGAWDARTSSMVLINALTNGPESLEERILLREEFSRRGLNEVIVVSVDCLSQFHCLLTVCQTLRYIRPPEELITQLDVYTEEKFEDEEDMRERASHLFHAGDRHNGSEISSILDELIAVTGTHTEDYFNVIGITKIMISFFQRLDERYGSRKNCGIFDDRAF